MLGKSRIFEDDNFDEKQENLLYHGDTGEIGDPNLDKVIQKGKSLSDGSIAAMTARGPAMTARRTDKPVYLGLVDGSFTKRSETMDGDTEKPTRSSVCSKVYMPQMRARRTDMSAYFTSTDGLLKEMEDEDTERSAPSSTCNKVYYDYAYTLAMG